MNISLNIAKMHCFKFKKMVKIAKQSKTNYFRGTLFSTKY